MLEQSDVVSFHNYKPLPETRRDVENLKRYGRRCSAPSYMARPAGSKFDPILAYLKGEARGGLQLGLRRRQDPRRSIPGTPGRSRTVTNPPSGSTTSSVPTGRRTARRRSSTSRGDGGEAVPVTPAVRSGAAEGSAILANSQGFVVRFLGSRHSRSSARSRVEDAVATVAYAHIEINEEGQPVIAKTRIKVRAIALDRIAYGWDAEEIQRHHPDLSLGEIHSALAYYFDHKEEMDRDIADRYARCRGMASRPGRIARTAEASGEGIAPVSLRLYMDHHVDAAIIEGLRRRGIDVVTSREDGTTTWDDDRLLERASLLGRVLFSQDDDLLAIARRWQHAGRTTPV